MTKEAERLTHPNPWRVWGPYLSARQWGTVREDYSLDGSAWDHLSHDDARSRAYRWGEDGILGISDNKQLLCFSCAFWNRKDPILKERFYGLSGPEGSHGEDVKELYYFLDGLPSHSYMKALFKYPITAYPYEALVKENNLRGRSEPEFEIGDTGAFDNGACFDVFVEYVKAAPTDILIRVTVTNRSEESADLDLIPQLWFRNTWDWGDDPRNPRMLPPGKPSIIRSARQASLVADHKDLGTYRLYYQGEPELLFCENRTNTAKLYGAAADGGTFKDGLHEAIVGGNSNAVTGDGPATKAGLRYSLSIPGGESAVTGLRLTAEENPTPFEDYADLFQQGIAEADEFYSNLQVGLEDTEQRSVQRQALAGMLWSKQFYYLDMPEWLDGDSGQPPPPRDKRDGRNAEWRHLNNADIISMPDTWEYPWYASWDLAFHTIPLALVDSGFAKSQLLLFTREWYMHPNGQMPAYEWAFGDVNPPVHAWATWRVFQIDRKQRGDAGDLVFLERVFHKLLLNFTWWVNRKDADGLNIFQGGFLGLDNIGVFDRSAPLPGGARIDQSDGTSWMAMYSLNLMRIALELARHNHVYEDIATKFLEHFLEIAHAMYNMGDSGVGLWDEEDEFYYDVLKTDHEVIPLKVRSIVGLIPLFAVEVLEPELLAEVPEFARRLKWFLNYRPELAGLVSRWNEPGVGNRHLLSLLRGHRMKMLLRRMLDPEEFLSDYGVRGLSRYHREHPYRLELEGQEYSVQYDPAESTTEMFGGNSNWRGPIWFPINYLIVESLQKFHHYYGNDFKIECPTGSGSFSSILEATRELSRRLVSIFLPDEKGRRPVFSDTPINNSDMKFCDYPLFYEYFHGDTGRGVGASHQTGWTGLVAKLIQPRGEKNDE